MEPSGVPPQKGPPFLVVMEEGSFTVDLSR